MKKIRLIVFCGMCLLLAGWRIEVSASFPSDMDSRPLKASALTEEVEIYEDAALQEQVTTVEGADYVFTATDVTDDQKALHVSYEKDSGEEAGQGWVSSSVFIKDTSYKHNYATVRAEMTIYSTSSLSSYQATIAKYSGVIAISEAGDAVQVIYETKKGYGIGWMDAGEYANRLNYDGRDKQLLADGSYHFVTSEQYAKEASETDQESEAGIKLTLTYVSKKMYTIMDKDQKAYLHIESEEIEETETEEEPEWREHGWKHVLLWIFSSSYRDKLDQWEAEQEEAAKEQELLQEQIASGEVYEDTEHQIRYLLSWTEEKEDADRFMLTRQGDYFTISWKDSSLYIGARADDSGDASAAREEEQSGQICLIMTKADSTSFSSSENESSEGEASAYLWRVRALASMVDRKDPMVFTQYDPQWCGNDYGSEGCIGTAGCGILATVNAVYALSGQYMSVMELADYAVETGLRIVGSGTDDGIFKAAAKKYGEKYGFAYDGESGSIDTLKKKLQAGDVATVHVIGHYVAVTAYDEKKDKYLLLDSNCLPKRETSAYGDWISPSRLLDGYLYGQMYYFFKLPEEK